MREGDAQGERLVLVNAATDRVERTLPDGVPAPDWTRLYTLEPGGGSSLSVLRVIDPRTGADVLTRQLDGHYEMPTFEGAVLEGLSADGHWLAVAGGERNPDGRLTTSSFLILDTRSWAPPRHVRLSGDFLFDGVSDSGRNLFLLESLTAPGPAGSPQYRVRRYDLATGTLDPVPVVDKSEAGGTMTGVAVSRVHSRDGITQYTLYALGNRGPFVHALDLENAVAHCIDLPAAAGVAGAAQFPGSLTMTENGSRLFAVGAAGDTIAEISPAGTPHLVRRSGYAGSAASPAAGVLPFVVPVEAKGAVVGGVALSGDARTLYALGEESVKVIDTATLTKRSEISLARRIDSLAVSPDGRWLFAASGISGRVLQIDTRSDAVVAIIDAVAGPQAILRVEPLT
jgi:hypothetical protein